MRLSRLQLKVRAPTRAAAPLCAPLTTRIVSEPGHPRRAFQTHLTRAGDPAMSAEDLRALDGQHDGSWWPAWHTWLREQSSRQVAARRLNAKYS